MGLEQLEATRQELIRSIANLKNLLKDANDPAIVQLQNKLAQVEAEITAAGGQLTRQYGAGAVHLENSEVQGTINTGTIITGGGDFVGRSKEEKTYHAPVYGGQGNTYYIGTPPPTNPQIPPAELPAVPPNLREKITQYLNKSELQGVCFDLGLDYSHLEGESFNEKVISLIGYCKRRNILEHLVRACHKANPHGQWS